jgi:hypothetical protein
MNSGNLRKCGYFASMHEFVAGSHSHTIFSAVGAASCRETRGRAVLCLPRRSFSKGGDRLIQVGTRLRQRLRGARQKPTLLSVILAQQTVSQFKKATSAYLPITI